MSKNSNIRFSIIIPCYNVENYIEKTIYSVLNQTYSNFEIIAIDDGSIDSTLKIIKNISRADERIRIFSQENLGVSETRNKGIELSQGEYIYFLDGDDLIEKNLLEEADKVFIEKGVGMFSFGYDVIFKNKKKIYLTERYTEGVFSSKEFLKKFLSKRLSQSISSFIVKKNILENVVFNNLLNQGEDLDFQIRILLEKKFKIYYLSNTYFHYLKRENSATTTSYIHPKYFNMLEALKKLTSSMNSNQIEEFDNYCIERFFYTIMTLLTKKDFKKKYLWIRTKLKEYDYVITRFRYKLKKRELMLGVLIVLYKINFKLLIISLKLKSKI